MPNILANEITIRRIGAIGAAVFLVAGFLIPPSSSADTECPENVRGVPSFAPM
jgi:hypothetical protein